MARVEKPLNFNEILKLHGTEVFNLLPSYGVVDEKGRYLHWNQFKRRLPAGINRVAAWGAVKLARVGVLRESGLFSEQDLPFRFFIPDSCHRTLHEVERLSARLGHSHADTTAAENRRYLVDSLMMEEAISSAQLEGAATTRQDAKEMLANDRPPRSDDEMMVVNNYLLMRAAKYEKQSELTIDLICHFHQIATTGIKEDQVNPGHIRERNNIYVASSSGDVAHQPPAADTLPERLQALCDFANEAHDGIDGRVFIHPVVKAIILHFMLGYEHPFVDGNGRTARCLFYWFMLKSGYWAFEYISISSLLKNAPIQYGESFIYTETDDMDLTYFIVYHLQIIERAINEFISYIEERRKEFYELMEWLEATGINKKLNYRQGHLLQKALRNPGRIFTAKEVTHDYDISDGTARTDLELLVKLKVLGKIKDGKTFLYISRDDAAEAIRRISARQ
ncbi:MAG: Fic family protein [Desulfuromonas sp.]|nr:Fic family protein [Desulfuromonas sp.]